MTDETKAATFETEGHPWHIRNSTTSTRSVLLAEDIRTQYNQGLHDTKKLRKA